MVAITIGTIEGAPSVKLVHASRGKLTRAEPVQKLYADGRVHHVGTLPRLEKEMCRWAPGMPSPNAMDAMVWSITDLMLSGAGGASLSSWLPDDDDDDDRRSWS
jgi:phage terminase large subunit-like protein